MAEPKRETLKVKNQRAILAAVLDPSEKTDSDDPLWEIRGLVETAGVEVVGQLTQNRRTPHPATLLGKGKLEELKMLTESLDAQLVVFDINPIYQFLMLTRWCIIDIEVNWWFWITGPAYALALLTVGVLYFWRGETTYGATT